MTYVLKAFRFLPAGHTADRDRAAYGALVADARTGLCLQGREQGALCIAIQPTARTPTGPATRDGTLVAVPILVMDPPPAEFAALLERRRLLGLDHRDEVWEGVYRMIPPPSHEHQAIAQQLAVLLDPLARSAGLEAVVQEFGLGEPDDYRVPDGALHRPGASGVWHPTAALVIEIISPGDDSWKKLPFFAAHRVDEVLIVDPEKRTVDWLALGGDGYEPVARSTLIDLGASELVERLDWP